MKSRWARAFSILTLSRSVVSAFAGVAPSILFLFLFPDPLVAQVTQTRVKVATINASLYGARSEELLERLSTGDHAGAKSMAAIVQKVRPDVLLINEIDFDPSGRVVEVLLERYLGRSQASQEPLAFPFHYTSAVNTGVDSGLDLDQDGMLSEPEDAWGFGKYPGQYGMVILSRYPIDSPRVRTFQQFLWSQMPGALRPVVPESGKSFYPDDVWNRLRLSSKSHWDIPIQVGASTLHVLASHPTPPTFDGREDRNGCRNHDEIRFWSDYLSPEDAGYIIDDRGGVGGLAVDQAFVVLGDLNADGEDGAGRGEAIRRLRTHVRVQDPQPRSEGGAAAKSRRRDARGDPALDTADFRFDNLRVDYVLPSTKFRVREAGVFWPLSGTPEAEWIEESDHRMVWVDLELRD